MCGPALSSSPRIAWTLLRIELLEAESTPLSIPLTGARVVDNSVTFTVRSRLLPEEGDCLYDPTVPLQLTAAAIAYTGRETAPSMVADFLPTVLHKVTIFIPQKPSAAESDAAVRLTTAVVARYGRQNTRRRRRIAWRRPGAATVDAVGT